MMTVSPPETSVRNRPRPTTAGISSAPARIAVWLVSPPLSVANAKTVRGVKSAVSDVIRSLARTMTGSVTSCSGSGFWPRSTNEHLPLDVDEFGDAAADFGAACSRSFSRRPPAVDEVADHPADGVLGRVRVVPDR